MTPIPPQLRIVLLIKLNLVKEVGRGSVYGYRSEKTRASGRMPWRDDIWKDVSRSLSVLNTTQGKKISNIFSPS